MEKKKNRLLLPIVFLALCFCTLLAIGPFFSIFKTSLQETLTITGNRNVEYTLINYIRLLTETSFPRWMMNSLIFAGSVTLLKVLFDTFAGYAFARYTFPGKTILFTIVLLTMMMPFAVAMLPLFKIVVKLKIVNTYWGMILPMVANPFGIFLMRQFISDLPIEMEESAKIDGASEFTILFKIVMPLSRPGQAVLAIVMFMWQWTNLIWPIIVTNKEQLFTLTAGLASIPSQHVIDWGLLTAGAFLSVIPIVIFFLFYQKGFISGLTMGAVKG